MRQHLPVTCELPRRSAQPAGAIAIVASAGGITALGTLLRSLPDTFPLPIFVAQHLARRPSMLDEILGRHCALNVGWAAHGAQPLGGRVYLVPPGMRLGVTAAGLHVSQLAPGASSWLTSGDHLINSVANLYGERSIAIVLSGMMRAGVNGMRAVRACGGFAIAQDCISSQFFDMPSAAIDLAKAEIVMPPERIANVLKIISQWWEDGSQSSDRTGPPFGHA